MAAIACEAVRAASKDGKTLTFEQKGTHSDGAKYDDISVYDRQNGPLPGEGPATAGPAGPGRRF